MPQLVLENLGHSGTVQWDLEPELTHRNEGIKVPITMG
jgi:hypothetical protein